MNTLIRTYTYLRYAEHQLQELEVILENGRFEDPAGHAEEIRRTVLNAISAALPLEKRDLHALSEKELLKVVSDLTFSSSEAVELISLLNALKLGDENKIKVSSVTQGYDNLALTARRLLDAMHTVFPKRPDIDF